MDISLFQNSRSGRVIRTTGGYYAFVPNPLPPELAWDSSLASLMSRADLALGTLSGLGETLPNPHLLLYPFIRREAVLSSRIEGTQSSLSDLLLFEATSVEKQQDVREVQNYVHALEYGVKRLQELPLSLALSVNCTVFLWKEYAVNRPCLDIELKQSKSRGGAV